MSKRSVSPIAYITENVNNNKPSLSPASVADTDLDTSAVKSIKSPPMNSNRPKMRPAISRAQSERVNTSFSRSSSMPHDSFNDDDTIKSSEGDGNEGDRPRRRRSFDSGSLADHFKHDANLVGKPGNLTISDSTVRILKQMSSNQLDAAKVQLSKVREQRRQSGLLDMGALNKKRLGMIMEMENEDRRDSMATIGNTIGDGTISRSSLETMPEGIEEELAGIEGSMGGMKRASSDSSKQRTKRLSDPVKVKKGDNLSRGTSSSGSSSRRGSSSKSERRQFSKSMGCMDDEPFEDDDDDEDESSDEMDDSENMDESARSAAFEGDPDLTKLKLQNDASFDKDEEQGGKDDVAGGDQNGAMRDRNDELDMSGRSRMVDEIANETFAKIVREHSGGEEEMGDSGTNEGNEATAADAATEKDVASNDAPQSTDVPPPPLYGNRRPARARRQGISTPNSSFKGKSPSPHGSMTSGSTWKPLSSNQHDPEPEDIDDEAKKEEEAAAKPQGGFGGFWNKLTASFTAESSPLGTEKKVLGAPPSPIPPKPKKEINGATYFRRGKRKANKCQFLQAVALYNFALVRQREELGENHIDCGTTLNEIGVCWMMLGERYPALTAFEEALFIRQKHLGDGAMEVAETTNNIWMILHEERAEMEMMMEEREEEETDG